MRLGRLEIENFRGVRSMDWWHMAETSALVGQGDSGISSILDAIAGCCLRHGAAYPAISGNLPGAGADPDWTATSPGTGKGCRTTFGKPVVSESNNGVLVDEYQTVLAARSTGGVSHDLLAMTGGKMTLECATSRRGSNPAP